GAVSDLREIGIRAQGKDTTTVRGISLGRDQEMAAAVAGGRREAGIAFEIAQALSEEIPTKEMPAMPMMIAARVHKQDEPMRLDRIPIPEPRSTDVLVEVKACGIVPNLARVIANAYKNPAPGTTRLLPDLPAIFGLDPAGVITKVGDQVRSVR